MSIQSEITRLTDAKTAIAAAIAAKGVTVPDGAKVPDFAALIDAIEAGGGGVASGTITPADPAAERLEIYHNLGVPPEFLMICAATSANEIYDSSSPKGQSFIYALKYNIINAQKMYYSRYLLTTTVGYNSGILGSTIGVRLNYYIACDDEKIIWANRNSSYGFGREAAPFFWIALKEISE